MKLFVNKPKFQRGGIKDATTHAGTVNRAGMERRESENRRHDPIPYPKLKSYVEVLKGNHMEDDKASNESMFRMVDAEAKKDSIIIQTTKKNTRWLENIWVGHMKNKAMFERVAEEVQGFSYTTWMMTEPRNLIAENKKMDELLLSLSKDGCQSCSRLIGIPLTAWDEENFAKLVSGYGELIELDEETRDRTRMDVARVLVRTKEKPNIVRSLIANMDGTKHQLEMREEMGDWVGKKDAPAGIGEIPTIAVHYGLGGIRRRANQSCLRRRILCQIFRRHSSAQWAKALNLWSTEIEPPTDDEVEPDLCCASQSEPARMTDDGLLKEDHNGPLLPNLHANGKVDPRDICPSQPYDRNEDIAAEDKEEANTDKRACFWATQDNPVVNTLQTLPMVNKDSNFVISNDRGTENRSLTLVEDRRDQKLGLVTKGPFLKGGVAENVKVYARRKEGVKEKSKAQINLDPTLCSIREEGEPSTLDLGDNSAAHYDVGAQPEPAIATLDTTLFQPQLSPTLPCNSNKQNKEAQESVFWDVARDLGMTFEENSGNIVNMKNELKQADISTTPQAKLTLSNKIDIMCIQETKKESIDKKLCQYLWGDSSVTWECVPSSNAAGGLLRVVGRGFIMLEGWWIKENKKVFTINVYAPCDLQGKRDQWEQLLQLKSSYQEGLWCILGDFNSIRHQHERLSSSQSVSNSTSITEFNSWISDMAVEEVRSIGRKFTWCRPNGGSMSKLDRFFLSDNWLSQWPDTTQFVLEMDFSDHCPILLRSINIDWGPKPFKIMDWWLKDKGFQKMVALKWGNYHPHGWGGYALKQKLKFIKGCIRQWSLSNGVTNADKIQNLKRDLNALEVGIHDRTLSQAEVELKKSLQEQLWFAANAYESMLRQKARVKWLKEGDRNSTYFHKQINYRRRRNAIQGLIIDGAWVHDPSSVKSAALTHFKDRFSEQNFNRPTLDGVQFPSLSQGEKESLVVRFSELEITSAILDCGRDKSPGPDGLNFNFIKQFWKILKPDFIRCFEMVSGLKINYAKSQFGCLGKSEGWCRDAAHFLNYSQLVFPFSYLGIPMGSNPKSWSVWQPIISKFDAKLAKWKQRYLSIDGRITLINFVLTALPIYLLSFFRIPKKVVHKIVSIQRNFLWRGGNEAAKIPWIVVSPPKPPLKPDPEVDDPLYLMTLTIPELFLRPYQVRWDATVFGVVNPDFPLYIKHEDLSEIAHGGQCLSISSIQRSGQSQFESESYIKSWMQSSQRDVYLGAYLNGGHWQMVVILPKEHLVVWFCSLHNRPDNYLKEIINSAIKGLDDAPQPKSKAPARWIVVKCNRQKGTIECGYYVMHWMSTIILGTFRNNWEAYFNNHRSLEPERLKALRIQWAQFYLRKTDVKLTY
ncbi:Transposon TX1 uncharacterized protein [Glycine soja]